MLFWKPKVSKELEIVSLIDVVFTLIIFGLVISVIGFVGKKIGPALPDAYTISITRTYAPDALKGDDSQGRLKVEFFDPDRKPIGGSADFPIDDSLLYSVLDSAAFDTLPACTLISSQIEQFAGLVRGSDNKVACEPITIQAEVTSDTKTRVVTYIAEQCVLHRECIGWVRFVSK